MKNADLIEVSESCELDIRGMTCAACKRRVERALWTLSGVVEADVNLLTERATVRFERGRTSPLALIQAIADAGYEAAERASAATSQVVLSTPSGDRVGDLAYRERLEERSLRRDVWLAALLAAPLLVLGMSHGALPGTDGIAGRWAQLMLATALLLGPGRRFLRLGWVALRHRASDMNTLVSVGAGAAWLYSTVAVLLPGLFPHGEHGAVPHLYFEATGAILSFVLFGKWLEGRARKRLSDAVRGLVTLVPERAASTGRVRRL